MKRSRVVVDRMKDLRMSNSIKDNQMSFKDEKTLVEIGTKSVFEKPWLTG
jgi:hypothetical protein